MSYYDSYGSDSGFLWALGIAVAFMIIVTFGAVWHSSNVTMESYLTDYSCDELGIKTASGSSQAKKALFENCMKELFPDNKKYPNDIQLHAYFLERNCEELGIHALKKGFDYKTALELYDIKCSTPLEHLELPKIILQITEREEVITKGTSRR